MPKALHRCVNKVKRQKGVNSAWAICQAARKKKKPKRPAGY